MVITDHWQEIWMVALILFIFTSWELHGGRADKPSSESPASSSPLPLLLLSSNFLNCKCRRKCNLILKRVLSKLERPSFQSELTCGKYLSIFHIWIYASSQLLRVWIVAQKLSEPVRLGFARQLGQFSSCSWQTFATAFDKDILLTVACLCKPIIPCTYKRPDENILNTSTIQRRCEHGTDCSLHERRGLMSFFTFCPSLWIPPTLTLIPCPDCFKGFVPAPDRGGRWVAVWLTTTKSFLKFRTTFNLCISCLMVWTYGANFHVNLAHYWDLSSGGYNIPHNLYITAL